MGLLAHRYDGREKKNAADFVWRRHCIWPALNVGVLVDLAAIKAQKPSFARFLSPAALRHGSEITTCVTDSDSVRESRSCRARWSAAGYIDDLNPDSCEGGNIKFNDSGRTREGNCNAPPCSPRHLPEVPRGSSNSTGPATHRHVSTGCAPQHHRILVEPIAGGLCLFYVEDDGFFVLLFPLRISTRKIAETRASESSIPPVPVREAGLTCIDGWCV